MDLLLVESLLDEYVASHGMVSGDRLPKIPDLARSLGWREHEVARALGSSTVKKKFVGDSEGWCVSPTHPGGRHGYSFTKSAEIHGNKLETHVLEAALRPPTSDEQHPFYRSERDARMTLGIKPDSSFLVISRCRIINGVPAAIQRAYLDPARFPVDFVNRNFSTESLISLYEQNGYKVHSRDTLLTARLPNQYEYGLLTQRYQVSHLTPVIDAEQCLYAEDPSGQRFVLEYLCAAYLENWKYEISNRPGQPEQSRRL